MVRRSCLWPMIGTQHCCHCCSQHASGQCVASCYWHMSCLCVCVYQYLPSPSPSSAGATYKHNNPVLSAEGSMHDVGAACVLLQHTLCLIEQAPVCPSLPAILLLLLLLLLLLPPLLFTTPHTTAPY